MQQLLFWVKIKG